MIALLNVYIYLCPQEEECTSSSRGHSKIYTPGTIANSQTDRAPTEINEIGAVFKVRDTIYKTIKAI